MQDISVGVCELVNTFEEFEIFTLSSACEMPRTSTRHDLPPIRSLWRATPLAVNKALAAELLSVSEDYLDEHVRPEIRVARVGRRVLFPVKELERWLDRHASRALDRL